MQIWQKTVFHHSFGIILGQHDGSLVDLQWATTAEYAERGRGSIDLIVVAPIWKGAQLLDEGTIPRTLDHFHEAVLALRGKRIGPVLLCAFFALG